MMFGRNLGQLLLTSPVPGRTLMGVDPGYKHGCKLAVISPTSKHIFYFFWYRSWLVINFTSCISRECGNNLNFQGIEDGLLTKRDMGIRIILPSYLSC